MIIVRGVAVIPLFFLVAFCLLLSFGFDYKMRVRSFVTAAINFATTSNTQSQHLLNTSSAVAATKATAKTLSPTSSVPGKTFDRFVNIWLENTDYEMAAGDRLQSYSRRKGPSLMIFSIAYMACNERHNTYKLLCSYSSKPAELHCRSRWQYPLGVRRLVRANFELSADDRGFAGC